MCFIGGRRRESFAFVLEHFIIIIRASATTVRIGNPIIKIDSWRYTLEFSLCCSIIDLILHHIQSSQTTTWTPVRLPYLKHPSQLPAPLPMEREFLESTMVLRDDASYHRVVAVGQYFIVKHGRGVHEREGQTLLFLEKHLGDAIHVPMLYAMYRMPSNGHLCLIMERLEGELLESLWPTLGEDDKSVICSALKNAISAIRKVHHPGFYGSVARGPVPYHLLQGRRYSDMRAL